VSERIGQREEPRESQVERTALAWSRTVLLLALIGALALRLAVTGPLEAPTALRPSLLVPAVLALLSAPGLLVVSTRRSRRLAEQVADGSPVAAPGLLRGTTLLVVLFSLACAGSVAAGVL
jgi:uncharacterized membrane protein YidH (DUF202 family)